MPDPDTTLEWARLFHGRLWHVASVLSGIAECGEEFDSTIAEYAVGQPPRNGWVCDRCVRELQRAWAAALLAYNNDPRRVTAFALPAAPEPAPDTQPAPAVSEPTAAPPPPAKTDAVSDLAAELRASLAAARDQEHGADPMAGVTKINPELGQS